MFLPSEGKNRELTMASSPSFLAGLKGQQLTGYYPVKGYKSILVMTANSSFFKVQPCYKMKISNLSPPSFKALNIIICQGERFFFFLIQYVDFWICDITRVWVQHNQDTDKADLSR